MSCSSTSNIISSSSSKSKSKFTTSTKRSRVYIERVCNDADVEYIPNPKSQMIKVIQPVTHVKKADIIQFIKDNPLSRLTIRSILKSQVVFETTFKYQNFNLLFICPVPFSHAIFDCDDELTLVTSQQIMDCILTSSKFTSI